MSYLLCSLTTFWSLKLASTTGVFIKTFCKCKEKSHITTDDLKKSTSLWNRTYHCRIHFAFSSNGLFAYLFTHLKQATCVLSGYPLICFCVVTEATVILQVICPAMFCFYVSVCIDLRKLTWRKYSCMQNWSNLCCNEPLSEYKLT